MKASIDVLLTLLTPVIFSLLGAVAWAAFLRLAAFSRLDISVEGVSWFVGGMFTSLLYMLLMPHIGSPLALFLSAVIASPLQLFPISTFEPSNARAKKWVFSLIWIYFWFAVCVGWRSGWFGLLFVTLPALIIAGGGLFYVAGFIVPFPEKSVEQRRQALRALLTFTWGTNYPYHVVIDEKIQERTEDERTWMRGEEKLIKRADGDLFGGFLSGPGVILTGCDHAVALSTGLKFKGAKGPGVIFTNMSDKPVEVIDLRVQLRAFPVQARTKDGIAIKVVTFTPFQIGAGKEKPELGKGFPYRSKDVFKALQAQMMEHQDASQVPKKLEQQKWYDLPEIIGERAVRQALSRYEFDQLYAPFELYTDFGQHPRSEIGRYLREELERVLPTWGLQRVGSGISNLEPVDPRLLEHRVEAWRADWARRIMLKQAAGQSKRLRLVEQSRAQAQVDIVLDIGKRLSKLRDAGDPLPMDQIARYFIEILETMVGRPELYRYLPAGTGQTVQSARRVIGGRAFGQEEE